MIPAEDRSLVARTLTLYERIDLYREQPSCFVAADAASERRASWRKAFDSLNDEGAFERRLRFDGFDRESILPVLGRLVLPDDYPAPEWLAVLSAVRDEMRKGGSTLRDVLRDLVPFGRYWAPWIAVAKRRVAIWEKLPAAVQLELESALLRDLAQSGTQCLMHEFDLERLSGLTTNDLVFARIKQVRSPGAAPPTNDRYLRFLDALHGVRRDSFFAQYPCFARLCATRVLFWARHVSELFERLERDRPLIEAKLGALGELVGIEADLGDSHNGGRQVAILHFSNARLVYKPKDLGTEAAFQSLAAHVNALGFSAPLKTIHVVARDGYGWVEHVTTAPCRSDDELARYYFRCGALVALVALLRGADCHFENIIASGDQPILIDHEVILAPRSAPESASATGMEALLERLEFSVLRTSLLPQWSVELDGTVVDLSGIGARPSARVKSRLAVKNLNSDDMTMEMTADVPILDPKAPIVEGRALRSAGDFEAEVLAGFHEVHRLLLGLAREKGREALLDLFAPFDGVTTRQVVRGTVGYGYLLRDTRNPELMRDGLDRTLALDRIARTFLGHERPPAWAVVKAEHASLVQGDVPYFALRSNATSIFRRDETTEKLVKLGDDVFTTSGWNAVFRILRDLSEEDTALESCLIAASFSGKAAGVASTREASRPNDDGLAPFDDQQALSKALAIARLVAKSGFTWKGDHHRVGLQYDEANGAHQVRLLGPELYNGNGGIAIFLAAAAHLAGDEDLRSAALLTLASARAELRRDPQAAIPTLGGFDGAGGILYAFARTSQLTGDPSLIDDARLLVRALTRRLVEKSPTHDLFSGTAGLVLGLVALAKIEGEKDASIKALIDHCGRHIVASAQVQEKGIGWPLHAGENALCGLAHGNAGIALALLEAWRAGGARELRDAAESALLYERSVRDDDAGNWPDLRVPDPKRTEPPPLMSTWCNGAPGILLTRSRILEIDDSLGNAREDFDLALATTRAAASPAVHLCCGTAGIDEILFEVGARIRDAALMDVARRRVFAIEIEEGRVPHLVGQALMRGASGIGLSLLRMTEAGRTIASVLDLG